MSHFTRVTTRLVVTTHVKQGLEDLGIPVIEGVAQVHGDQGATAVDFAVRVPEGGEVGFKWNGHSYDMVADWYRVRAESAGFLNRLHQRYAYHATREVMAAKGFDVVEEETAKSGEIRLTLRRIA